MFSIMKNHELRIAAALRGENNIEDNIYELKRTRILRVVREHGGNLVFAAERLGCSVGTVRRSLRFVAFEHLLKDPSLADRFDWRTMTRRKWRRLLIRRPEFISRLPKRPDGDVLYSRDVAEILSRRPELAPHFDLNSWNELNLDFCWSKLLSHRPEFAALCDFAAWEEGGAVRDLLCCQPQFFDSARLELLLPYHWDILLRHQPHLSRRMEARAQREWPFGYRVYHLLHHPEDEAEFTEWDRVEEEDRLDFRREQPGIYVRHFAQKNTGGD
ncbi:MAG: hypothetical protein PUK77_00320 [bacterium]|nr:hypothetical protein [bacterium]